MKNYVIYNPSEKEVLIRGISISRLKQRIIDTYSSNNMVNPVNGAKYLNLFNRMDYINWAETEMTFYSFFALEIYEMFAELADKYHDFKYQDVADELYEKTWISNYKLKDRITIDTTPLVQFNIQLKDFQLQFIKEYPSLKYQYDLNGYILSFEQGLGKTFTAIALGECLKKERFYIVCPNSLKEVWALEIKKYYKKYNNNEKLWKQEVYVNGTDMATFTNSTTKFLIVNQESIQNLYPYIDKNKDSIIIVDESHNFRNKDAKRVDALLKLKELSQSTDVLLMSGTPIKATANEIVPALRMIDPHFTAKLADLYNRVFSSTSLEAASITKARFKRVIYRKMKKDTLKLPEIYITDLKLKIPKPEKYATNKAKKEILEYFHKDYLERLQSGIFTNNKQSPFYRSSAPGYDFVDERILFENTVKKYSRAKNEITNAYLRKIFQESEDLNNFKLINAQNVDDEYFAFLNKYVKPFVKTPAEKEIVSTRFNGILGWSIAAKGATGSAIGTITAKYKNACFTEIWQYNYEEIISMIQKAKKKTVIFSSLVPVIEYISNDLNKRGIETVKITGSNQNRIDLIESFKNDDNIKVLAATTQTLSTGVTLTEANQVIFFGTPYRSVDVEQAYSRIHRIGQDENCYVYNILLWSYEKNITGRIEDIVNWSGEMFDALINENYII